MRPEHTDQTAHCKYTGVDQEAKVIMTFIISSLGDRSLLGICLLFDFRAFTYGIQRYLLRAVLGIINISGKRFLSSRDQHSTLRDVFWKGATSISKNISEDNGVRGSMCTCVKMS